MNLSTSPERMIPAILKKAQNVIIPYGHPHRETVDTVAAEYHTTM